MRTLSRQELTVAVHMALGVELLLWCTVLALVRLGFPFGALAASLLVACTNAFALAGGIRWGASRGGIHIRWPGWLRFLLWFTPAGIYALPAWVSRNAFVEPGDEPLPEWERRTVLWVGTGLVSIGCLLAALLLNVPSPVRAGAAALPLERLTSYCSIAIRASAVPRPFDEEPGPAPGCACAADAFLQRLKVERPEKIELALILIEDSVRNRQRIPDSHIAGLWSMGLRACRAR